MVSPLENVILKLNQLGFFAFLPFLLTAAIFYGLLRRSKIFGEPEKNVAVNGTVAIVAAFMVWAYPILAGTSVEEYQKLYSTFFFRGTVASLIFIFGIMIASMVLPESFTEKSESIKKHVPLILLGIMLIVALFLSSEILSIFGVQTGTIDTELVYSIVFLVVFIAIIGGVVWLTGKETKTK